MHSRHSYTPRHREGGWKRIVLCLLLTWPLLIFLSRRPPAYPLPLQTHTSVPLSLPSPQSRHGRGGWGKKIKRREGPCLLARDAPMSDTLLYLRHFHTDSCTSPRATAEPWGAGGGWASRTQPPLLSTGS